VTSSGDGDVVAFAGSQLRTRAVGIWFADTDSLPRRVRISISATGGGGTAVTATIEEQLGNVTLGRLARNRYTRVFRSWLLGLGTDLDRPVAHPV
jgi:hypothetical protein